MVIFMMDHQREGKNICVLGIILSVILCVQKIALNAHGASENGLGNESMKIC
jgi:hypothetical protein